MANPISVRKAAPHCKADTRFNVTESALDCVQWCALQGENIQKCIRMGITVLKIVISGIKSSVICSHDDGGTNVTISRNLTKS